MLVIILGVNTLNSLSKSKDFNWVYQQQQQFYTYNKGHS